MDQICPKCGMELDVKPNENGARANHYGDDCVKAMAREIQRLRREVDELKKK